MQGFIAVYNGPPTCEHALVDYKLGKEDVYYNDEADAAAAGGISVSDGLGFFVAEKKREIKFSGCLSLLVLRVWIIYIVKFYEGVIYEGKFKRETDYLYTLYL